MIAAKCSSVFSFSQILLLQKKYNSESKEGEIALLDASLQLSDRILAAAEKMAVDAIATKTAVSSKLEIEFLLWLAKTPQVKKAIEIAGAKGNCGLVLALVEGAGEKDFAIAAKALGAKIIRKLPAKSDADLDFIEGMALSRIG